MQTEIYLFAGIASLPAKRAPKRSVKGGAAPDPSGIAWVGIVFRNTNRFSDDANQLAFGVPWLLLHPGFGDPAVDPGNDIAAAVGFHVLQL